MNNYKRNEKSDIYSLGLLFWEISSGKPPFSEIPILGIINGIREIPIENTPIEYQKLYEDCWKVDPEQRPDINKVHEVLINLESQFTNNEQRINVKTIQNYSSSNINNDPGTSAETHYDDSNIGNLGLQN